LKTHKRFVPSIAVLIGRLLAIGLRYLGILYLGYILSKDDFANFNLINSGVIYLLFFVGFDYYNKLHRSYFEDQNKFKESLTNYLFLLICIVPLVYFVCTKMISSVYGEQNWIYSFSLLLILYSELFFLEIYRFEILRTKLQLANFWLTTRYLWFILYFIIEYFFDFESINILILWGFASSITLYLLVTLLYPNVNKINIFFSKNISVKSTLLDLKNISFLFLATLLIRGIFFFDKWIPEWLSVNKELIATYAFIFTLSSSLGIIIDVTLTSNYYGEMLKTCKINYNNFLKIQNEFNKYTTYITIFFLFLTIITFLHDFKIEVLGFKITATNLTLAFFAQSLYNSGLPDHYGLYCLKQDKKILSSNLIGLISFILLLTLSINLFTPTIDLIYYSLIIAFTTIWVVKKLYFNEFKN
jgi:hypothetical protein